MIILVTHKVSKRALAIALYSDSLEERETIFCFFEDQLIGLVKTTGVPRCGNSVRDIPTQICIRVYTQIEVLHGGYTEAQLDNSMQVTEDMLHRFSMKF